MYGSSDAWKKVLAELDNNPKKIHGDFFYLGLCTIISWLHFSPKEKQQMYDVIHNHPRYVEDEHIWGLTKEGNLQRKRFVADLIHDIEGLEKFNIPFKVKYE